MGVRVTGLNEVKAELRNISERVSKNARKVMAREAERIVKEARLNAPNLRGNLEESISIERTYGDRGRLQIDIGMVEEVNGVDVSDYATEMHENYESYNPGPGTIAKRQANPGRYVGGQFLQRAVDEGEKRLPDEIENEISSDINRTL